MITDVPTKRDFEDQGLILLNLAWDSVINLLLEYQEAEEWEGTIVESEQTEHYLEAAQKPLAISTVLLQQGAEFLVKAAIAEISPYLLIAGNAPSWPRKCDVEDKSFSEFKTADAGDLIRLHDTVTKKRLSNEFSKQFLEMRRVRNTVFHTVDLKQRFSDKEILNSILNISTEMFGPSKWIANRSSYLDSIPAAAWCVDGMGYRVVKEISIVIDLLDNSKLETHFGLIKDQRRYICPSCMYECSSADSDFMPFTAQLSPNSPKSHEVSCIVCEGSFQVERKACCEPECKGNVIYDRECLTCYADNGKA